MKKVESEIWDNLCAGDIIFLKESPGMYSNTNCSWKWIYDKWKGVPITFARKLEGRYEGCFVVSEVYGHFRKQWIDFDMIIAYRNEMSATTLSYSLDDLFREVRNV